MMITLHIFCTFFLVMVGWARWETFYEDGYTICKNRQYGFGEILWDVVIALMLYYMWTGK